MSVPGPAADPGLLPPPDARALLAAGGAILAGLDALPEARAQAIVRAQHAYEQVRRRSARAALAALPIAALRPLAPRLPDEELAAAGFATVADVAAATQQQLDAVPGVGEVTARQLIAAAAQVYAAQGQSQRVRLSRDAADPDSHALVAALRAALTLDAISRDDSVPAFAEAVRRAVSKAELASGRLKWFLSGSGSKASAIAGLRELAGLVRSPQGDALTSALGRTPAVGEPAEAAWADFEARAADYYALLGQLVPLPAEAAAAEGFLPAEIVARVREQQLDGALMTVTLRGYQDFGAKFALVQRRVIIGDEMGLGKTMQALAAMAHLRSSGGASHFLVVSPASVLINWLREISTRTKLPGHRVHGDDREAALQDWLAQGGVAVVTYDSLQAVSVPPGVVVSMLIVDEAHYVKNPQTARSKVMRLWTERVDRVLFLTGTPMENRLQEFQTLVGYLQPQLVSGVGDEHTVAGGEAFRRAVAPVYLRRNQIDVLSELPELVENDDWVEFTAADAGCYREAVAAGNFMAMRQAAYMATGDDSAKLARIRDVLEDAAGNGLKVLVFSFFLGVLERVSAAIAGELGPQFGPITGATPPARRQEMVDAFSAHQGHAVLLGQIQASGVGLNMQAASVVILCEPQVKPTTEHQAVARAHRMGQVRTVLVHRVLAEDSVDERLLELLAGKDRLFDAYARRSQLAEASPEAMDPSEIGLAARVVQLEQARLAAAQPQAAD